ncbi:hypothetical protein [Mycobacteroides abscessus]|uniref:hypothetical protein n=1 Tax=Mycobacteroides abscessus TaxID=36809 RepID=UPI000925CEA3|nr:hypothetical protein [Mycobacteroides abscessus]SIN21221.1 Uncharacterised protein [Mycobacteroides abscessus subsp. abscessus]
MSEETQDAGNENTGAEDDLTPWWRAPGMFWKIWLPIALFLICMVVLYAKIGYALFTH